MRFVKSTNSRNELSQVWCSQNYAIVQADNFRRYRIQVIEMNVVLRPAFRVPANSIRCIDIVVTEPTVANIIVMDIINSLKPLVVDASPEEVNTCVRLALSRYSHLYAEPSGEFAEISYEVHNAG